MQRQTAGRVAHVRVTKDDLAPQVRGSRGVQMKEARSMTNSRYAAFDALSPFFDIVMEGLTGLVHGKHFFDVIADDSFFDFRYDFPGWPRTIRGRTALMDQFSVYGKSIRLHSADGLVVHRSQDGRVVILEYDVHGTILATGVPYDNRFSSIITIENRKVVHWRDYMDSLAAWTALNGKKVPATPSRQERSPRNGAR